MNFVSTEFAIFFLLVFFIYWRLDRERQNIFLLLASLFFYGYFNWRFLGLILTATLSSYYCGLRIGTTEKPRARKLWLAINIAINMAMLVYFKYANFFVASAQELATQLGWHLSQVTLDIILPAGISFFVFQSLSYSLDIYRRQLTPHFKLLDFATFATFFPHLVAGPIVRAKEFLYQLEARREFSVNQFETGVIRFTTGFFKKAFIADNLAILIDPVFSSPDAYSSSSLWLAMLGYAVQIYADFSGYTNMAIGSALMLGFILPENFRYPYLATDFSDFWRRWHMTMSRFFRDYVYIPLGGNRVSYIRNLINLAITTLISGLWHGAAWTFVIWGGLHGIYIACNHALRDAMAKISTTAHWNLLLRYRVLTGWFITQLLICFAWVLFRSPDITSAHNYLRGLFLPDITHTQHLTFTPIITLCFLGFLLDHLYGWLEEKNIGCKFLHHPLLSPIMLVTLIILLFNGKPQGANPFIYFQF